MLKRKRLPKKRGDGLVRHETWGQLVLLDIQDEWCDDPQYAMICNCGNQCFVRARYFTDKYNVKCCADVDKLDTGYISSTLSDPDLVDPCCCRRCLEGEEKREEQEFKAARKKERARPMGRPKSNDPGRATSVFLPESLREQIEMFALDNKMPIGTAIKTLIGKGLVAVLEESV